MCKWKVLAILRLTVANFLAYGVGLDPKASPSKCHGMGIICPQLIIWEP